MEMKKFFIIMNFFVFIHRTIAKIYIKVQSLNVQKLIFKIVIKKSLLIILIQKIFEKAPESKRKKNQIKLINYLSAKKINY